MEKPEDESRVRATVWGPNEPLSPADLIDRAADVIERQGWTQGVMFDHPTTKDGWRKLYDDFDWYNFDDRGTESETVISRATGKPYRVQIRNALTTCIYMKPEGFAEVKVCAIGALNMAAYGVPYTPAYGELPHRGTWERALDLITDALHAVSSNTSVTAWNDMPAQTAEQVVRNLREVAANARKG